LIYVHGRDLRAGLREIAEQAGGAPIGFNAIVEKSAKAYEQRMRSWVGIALEEGVRFFVTALGNPRWVVDAVHAEGGFVYHDVTERKFAEKALSEGVDGLICVNARAGGHAGQRNPEALLAELSDLGVPLVRAGGVGDEREFARALEMGYAGVQMGTRFIATHECQVHDSYRQAIVDAKAEDIVLTDKLSGVPCAVIRTDVVDRLGANATGLSRWLLKNRKTKHWMRTLYAMRALRSLKRSALRGLGDKDVWQAGKSVGGIDEVLPVAEVVRRCREATAVD
ncbi:MAG: nitronate monooxygenase, partial [Planctomycetota bacterium]